MTELHLEYGGAAVKITATDSGAEEALLELREDFSAFGEATGGAGEEPAVLIELASGSPEEEKAPERTKVFSTRMCTVFGWQSPRVCRYGDDAIAVDDGGKHRRIRIRSKGPELLREIAYTALLSAWGEALDLRGYHRVHALGLSVRGQGLLIPMSQGGGKSTIATLLKGDPTIRFLGEETVLLRQGVLHPFPLRQALRPDVARSLGLPEPGAGSGCRIFRRKRFPEKWLYPFERGEVAEPVALTRILAGTTGSTTPIIEPASRARAFGALFVSSVVGLGNAQMAEFMLRADATPALVRIAGSRLRESVEAVWKAPGFVFWLSGDSKANAEELRRFLAGLSGSS